jgi:transcriptional regulator with XRE-family HTH domain
MVRRRVLARQLKLLREQSGLTLEEAAPKLHFSVSKLSRIENAQVVIDIHWVKSMLDVYDVGGTRWTELLELAEEALQPGWWRAYGLGNNSYIAFETEASQLLEFTVSYVPGILQTADYARALMRAVPLRRTEEQLENEVAARIYRQQRLTSDDNPLEVVAAIDESALHRPVGGAAVQRDQLAHIAALAELDTVALHILPTAVGAHAALPSGFMILNFGDLDEPDMAYVEHTLGALSLDKAGDVARARLTFERVLSDALDPAESLALVRQLVGGEFVRRSGRA